MADEEHNPAATDAAASASEAAEEAGALINQTFGLLVSMTALRSIFELGLIEVTFIPQHVHKPSTDAISHSLFQRVAP
jgi:hypothetical protein